MTNEDKALEIFPDMPTLIPLCTGVREKLVEMAEWKDKQFISMLPDIFDFFVDNIGLYDGGVSHEDTDKQWFIEEFTNRILKNKS